MSFTQSCAAFVLPLLCSNNLVPYWVCSLHSAVLVLSSPAVQDQSTPLYMAARMGHVKVVRLLVQAGANLGQADKVRGAPLTSYSHEAISLPSAGYVTLLSVFFT